MLVFPCYRAIRRLGKLGGRVVPLHRYLGLIVTGLISLRLDAQGKGKNVEWNGAGSWQHQDTFIYPIYCTKQR